MKLTSRARKALPKSDFAVPGRKYPINDPNHARDALSRVSANGTSAQKAEVRAAVHRKYPSIGEKSVSKSKERSHHGPTEGMQSRGHFKNQGKGEMGHKEFEAIDHGKNDHMIGRTKKPFECGQARWGLLAFLAALALPLLAFAGGSAPYGVFGGAGTFAQLPGNAPLTFTAAPSGASATLASSWPGTSGSYLVVFSDWESRTVTLTNAATTATWTGNLTGSGLSATATLDGYTAPPGSPTSGYTSDLGEVWSNGNAWYSDGGPTGSPVTISAGCATVSSPAGTQTAGQFKTTATTCNATIQLPPAPNGWSCFVVDVTHPVVFTQTATTTYSCAVTATTTSGDTVQFTATPY